ncbi:MAG: hypothetical protein HY423_08655 [Candidatus Lambdaproteobacteria bacterium]|nr:hypothetical protein [Candidatus Lambdaproteobacteria bacterium]
MNGTIDVLNRLVAAWIERQAGVGPFRVRQMVLEPDGARLLGRWDHAQAAGELALRIRIEPAREGRQRLHLGVERLPERLPAALEPFRRLLATATLTLELNLEPEGEPAPGRAATL